MPEKRGNTPEKASDLNENPFIIYIISENPTVQVSSSNLQNVEFRFFMAIIFFILAISFSISVFLSNRKWGVYFYGTWY